MNLISSKLKRNYYVDIIAFLPFIILLVSGIIMLLYHTGKPYSITTLGFDGNFWILFHKFVSVIAMFMIIIHLSLHFAWLKNLFTFKLKSKHKWKNFGLFITFCLCSLTSIFSWLIINDTAINQALKGIHNKFGLLLIVFFAFHIIIYFKWLVNNTIKLFFNKNESFAK